MFYNLPMMLTVLATKLYIPPLPPKIVPRSRLIQRLTVELTAGRKLILVSAPAGFGKTTLINAWLKHCGRPAAWLSLDETDGDPARFLAYLVSALQKISPGFGMDSLGALQAPQPPTLDTIQTALLNEIAAQQQDLILVLDDYHLVNSNAIDQALLFFVEHLPPHVHLVITTRQDPPLPLARLRARNQLTEIRATDLRFSENEAAEFMNQVMGLNLAAEDVATLDKRTEGWVAGLQLVALSMKEQVDIQAFIRAFAGDHRYILDYLVEEVLQHQPAEIRNFLLQTSILERLNASLCEAVTSQAESKARLESLVRANLFVIPLDDKRHWYRYHHLFAEVLHLHLQAEQPEQLPDLHLRASEWYEQNNLMAEAIRHAFAANDFERAANLIERLVPEIRRSRQELMLLNWLQALPDELLQFRPVLCAHYAWALLSTGRLEGVEARLQTAEHWLETPGGQQPVMVIVDEAEFHRLPGLIALYRAAYFMAQGKVDDTVKYARQALALTAEEDALGRGAASALLGLASWWQGNLRVAEQSYIKGIALLQQVGYLSDAIGCALALADIQIAQGRLREAMHTYQRGLQLATTNSEIILRGAADMLVGMSRLYYEQNDLDAAEQYLQQSRDLGEFAGLPQNRYRWRVAQAGIRVTQGAFDEALALLDEAERLYMGDLSPNIHPIAALKVRVWVAQGHIEEANRWAREKAPILKENFHYLNEFEQLTLAIALLARKDTDAVESASELLEQLLGFAEAGGRVRSIIEILVLQALVHQQRGNISASMVALERALALAEPEGSQRIFLQQGATLTGLLRKSAARGYLPTYTCRLLSAIEEEERPNREVAAPASMQEIEPLSPRELDLLRLFKTDLSGPEIAQELIIALSTVRTHTKSIYNKLNVNNRRAAVRRAIELGLL